MDFYLKFEDNTEIKLPIIPESFEISTKQNNNIIETVSGGELNLKGNKGLSSISFSSFFPSSSVHGGYSTRAKFKEPYTLVNKIESKKTKKSAVRLIITETNINKLFLIDEFTFGEQDATRDVYYTISFSEYVAPDITVSSGGVTSLAGNRAKKSASKTYTVKTGDTLKKIAKSQLGSSSKFTKLAALNHISPPYKIKAGQVILIK